MLDSRLNGILHKIYEAASTPDLWPLTLKAIAADLRAAMTSLIEHRVPTGQDIVQHAFGLDDAYRSSYESYYFQRNIYLARGLSHLQPDRAINHQAYCSDSELLASEYYNDFQRRLGLMHVSAGSVIQTRERIVLLSVSRPPGRAPLSPSELERVEFLLPHIRRSLQLTDRLHTRSQKTDPPIGHHPPLTRTEAHFAELLVSGRSIQEICSSLSIRTTTARTHLRHLFEKTGTRRQPELVAALLRPRQET
ncbi:MAG: hypothetical protein H7039_03690 [Bryobacteraceae bacterium]|nr:hypothetical protein [Bryobacteraceae bacterium]